MGCVWGVENHIKPSDLRLNPSAFLRILVNNKPLAISVFWQSVIGDLERIFIFALGFGLQFLSEFNHCYADGTLKISPKVFYQVYIVHGQQQGRTFLCVFRLLPNGIEVTYTRDFR